MILLVQHETRLQYSKPVTDWLAEVRMEPVSDERQTCQSFHLDVSEHAGPFRYQDGFGNHVHHFNLLAPPQEVRILAAGLVETYPAQDMLAASSASFPLLADGVPLEALDFLSFRGPVSQTALLEPLLNELRPTSSVPLGTVVRSISNYIKNHFEYARDVTNSSSPISETLRHGKGVCQDFAHVMIAILRSLGVPARYVSGYIHRPNKESQSHAWCEVWLPDINWVGIDPTNDTLIDESFIKVANGRDFTDVPPNKGIYHGPGEETIQVRVETTELARMPSLSWQEHLRPMDAPLTTIRRLDQRHQEQEEQSQQMQQ